MSDCERKSLKEKINRLDYKNTRYHKKWGDKALLKIEGWCKCTRYCSSVGRGNNSTSLALGGIYSGIYIFF